MKYELQLTLPKLSGIKLSSSSDTKAVQICKPELNQRAVYDKISINFRKQNEDNFIRTEKDQDREILVMVMPERCVRSEFSEITQTHTIIIEDIFGQWLSLKVRYSSKAAELTKSLAAVGKHMLDNPEKRFVIFGNAYIENGQCCIYPIAVFDNILMELPEADEYKPVIRKAYSYFDKLFHQLLDSLCDIIQCGVRSFDLYGNIRDYGNECKRSGLSILGERLLQLTELFEARNHTYSDDCREIIRLIGNIYSYLKTGIEKSQIRCAINNLYESEEK